MDRRLGRRSGRAVPDGAALRWSGFTANATPASPPSTSTSIWPEATASAGATRGRRTICRDAVCWPRRRGVGRIGASDRGDRWSACCCTRTARPCLARRAASARPGGHARRCHRHDLLGDPGGGGRQRCRASWALAESIAGMACPAPLYRSWQPLFPYPGSRRQGRQGRAHPGRPGARPARHRAHRRLFAGSARALRTCLPHAAGPASQGTRARRYPCRLEAANRYIREVYLPAHNARFAVTPAESGSAFVPVAEAQWRDCSAFRRSASSRPITRLPGNGSACKSRRIRRAPILSAQRPRAPICQTANSPSSMGRAAWCSLPAGPAHQPGPPREPLSPRSGAPVDAVDKPTGLPTAPTGSNNSKKRSIHLLPKPDTFRSPLQD